MKEFQDPHTILELILNARTVALVGLSHNELRASHFVGYYLQRHGYRVVPVNPHEEQVLGERAYPTLADVPERIDVVDVFRNPAAVPELAREAADAGAGCMKVEHARYLGRMHWLGFNTGAISGKRATST